LVTIIRKSPFFIIAILLLSLTNPLLAETSTEEKAIDQAEVIGHVASLKGEAIGCNGEPLKQGSPITQGMIITHAGSKITLRMIDSASITLGENSQLAINHYRFQKKGTDNRIAMKFVIGTLRVVSGEVGKNASDTNRTKTPKTVLNIKGTDYQIDIKDDEESIQVKQGRVTLKEPKVMGPPKRIALGDKEDCCLAISKPLKGKRGMSKWKTFSEVNRPKDFPPLLEIDLPLEEKAKGVSKASSVVTVIHQMLIFS
jgi:hypothetical protein